MQSDHFIIKARLFDKPYKAGSEHRHIILPEYCVVFCAHDAGLYGSIDIQSVWCAQLFIVFLYLLLLVTLLWP